MTSKKDKTVCLTEWEFSQEHDVGPSGKRMWNHPEIEWAFIHWGGCAGVSRNRRRHRPAFHSAWFWFGCFFQLVRLQFLQCLGLSMHFMGIALHGTLFQTSLCISTDGLQCFVLSCWQKPDKCHTQLPSGSAPHGGGWQSSLCFKHVWSTRGRINWAPWQHRY